MCSATAAAPSSREVVLCKVTYAMAAATAAALARIKETCLQLLQLLESSYPGLARSLPTLVSMNNAHSEVQ